MQASSPETVRARKGVSVQGLAVAVAIFCVAAAATSSLITKKAPVESKVVFKAAASSVPEIASETEADFDLSLLDDPIAEPDAPPAPEPTPEPEIKKEKPKGKSKNTAPANKTIEKIVIKKTTRKKSVVAAKKTAQSRRAATAPPEEELDRTRFAPYAPYPSGGVTPPASRPAAQRTPSLAPHVLIGSVNETRAAAPAPTFVYSGEPKTKTGKTPEFNVSELVSLKDFHSDSVTGAPVAVSKEYSPYVDDYLIKEYADKEAAALIKSKKNAPKTNPSTTSRERVVQWYSVHVGLTDSLKRANILRDVLLAQGFPDARTLQAHNGSYLVSLGKYTLKNDADDVAKTIKERTGMSPRIYEKTETIP